MNIIVILQLLLFYVMETLQIKRCEAKTFNFYEYDIILEWIIMPLDIYKLLQSFFTTCV